MDLFFLFSRAFPWRDVPDVSPVVPFVLRPFFRFSFPLDLDDLPFFISLLKSLSSLCRRRFSSRKVSLASLSESRKSRRGLG